MSDGPVRIKPHALNLVVKQAEGKYHAFYDAADGPDQVGKAVRLKLCLMLPATSANSSLIFFFAARSAFCPFGVARKTRLRDFPSRSSHHRR